CSPRRRWARAGCGCSRASTPPSSPPGLPPARRASRSPRRAPPLRPCSKEPAHEPLPRSPDLPAPTGASGTGNPYAEEVPRPAEPPQTGRSRWARLWHNLGRDSLLVAPGLVISAIAVPTLVTLFAASIATVVIWVGLLLLPLTLTIARAFG